MYRSIKNVVGLRKLFIKYNEQLIKKQCNKMGNSSTNRPNLLARNWIKVNNLTYRNVTTNELIDECRIQYQTDEQLSSGAALLMKRTNINHPNIVKLIYFCQDNNKTSCRGSVYSHRLYVEHCPFNLRDLIKPNTLTKRKEECICCPVINGLFFLAQRYGFFVVKQQMILVNEREWPNSTRKRSIKVWMNSELSRSECQIVCNQQKMCEGIAIIYKNMFQHQLCSNPRIRELIKFRSLVEQLNFVLQLHQLQPQLIKNPSNLGKPCHQSQFIGSSLKIQNKEPLIRTSNRSYSTYVKQEGIGIPKRDNSIVPQVTFANSNKKIAVVNSQMAFRNITRPPSPSVKINFLFANSTQQNTNTQKDNIPVQQPSITQPQTSTHTNIPNIIILNNINPVIEKEINVVRVESYIQKTAQQTTLNQTKANQHKNNQQEKFKNQPSLPSQTHSSNIAKQPEKQPIPIQQIIQNQPPLLLLPPPPPKQAAISIKQQLRNEFKNVFQDEPTHEQVSEFTHEEQRQPQIQPKPSKKTDKPSGKIKKASTASNNYSSKLQKEEASRQESNQYHNNTKLNSNLHYRNDSKQESDSDKFHISDQDNSMFYRQSQTRPKIKQINTSVLDSVPGSSDHSLDHQQSNFVDSKQIRKNRKKRQKIQLEKDLQHEKDIIKKEMAMLLKSNMMVDQTNRIKEKVNNKKATFAELKAEASKILGGLGF